MPNTFSIVITGPDGTYCLKEIESSATYLMVVKVGSDDRPATSEDIQDIGNQIAAALEAKGTVAIVTHHLVEFEYVTLQPNALAG